MDDRDTRRSYWGSPAMWGNVAAASFLALVVFLGLVGARSVPPSAAGWTAAVVAAPVVAVVLAALVVRRRRERWLRARPLLDAIVANRAVILDEELQPAFDAVMRAIGTLRSARLDPERTSVVRGTVTATTRWNRVSNGERIDVRLDELDAEHVAVVVDVRAKYRGTRVDSRRVTHQLARFFSALPFERAHARS